MTEEDDIFSEKREEGKPKKLASSSNPLLMRLRLASLLITGHKQYPDALSRLTNLQVSIFALFDAIREKTIKYQETEALIPVRGSRYFATRERYLGTSPSSEIPEVYLYYGLKTFTERYKSLSQSIMGDARKEYLSGIEEKPVQLRYGSRDDLDIPKPSIYEAITGKPKRGDQQQ
jgi:hypothetical protein